LRRLAGVSAAGVPTHMLFVRRGGEWEPAAEILSGAQRSRRISKKEKATNISVDSLYLCRQRPTLPHTFACSTIGPAGLNFRGRDGDGWIPRGKITDNLGRLRA